MKISVKKHNKRRHILLFIAMMVSVMPSFALTPSEVLEKGRQKIASAKTLTADFSMKINGQSVKGTISSKGNKFAIVSNLTSNWYNGKDLYTYNGMNKETSVFKPSASDLADVNPLLYISTAKNYNVSATKNKKTGLETVVLIPKQKGSSVKSVTIDFDASTYLPKSILVAPVSGGAIQLSLSNIKLNGSVADSQFEYPKSKYPKVKINDLR